MPASLPDSSMCCLSDCDPSERYTFCAWCGRWTHVDEGTDGCPECEPVPVAEAQLTAWMQARAWNLLWEPGESPQDTWTHVGPVAGEA